ncbi:sulfite exporter TauE/SafE family protein [Kangiella sp. TOML190]|uniref:sulfite exporter TauE/SafE family protein n=1 Tax=Kangiella sp. TOML190 TaxID=2931351 RepID=UPI00203F6FD8|nr:sulfite exporter TauE/SafE family protein [Kangiella sp. TOML190]
MNSLYWTAFAMGLFGSLHCLGMCGGITVAFNQAIDTNKATNLAFTYQFFRIVSYALLGAISATFGYLFTDLKVPILPLLSGLFMIFLGIYLLNIHGPLQLLEKLGYRIWRKVQPLQKTFLPISKSYQAMAIGLLWGLLPCGLVYGALALAVSSGSPLAGFTTMLCFGLGTLPMMLSVGLVSKKLLSFLQQPWLRNLAAALFIAWGGYFIYSALADPHQHDHSHDAKQQEQTPKEHHHQH